MRFFRFELLEFNDQLLLYYIVVSIGRFFNLHCVEPSEIVFITH